MSAGTRVTSPTTPPPLAAAPGRPSPLTERIGRLDRLPGGGTLPPPIPPPRVRPVTAPSTGRRTTRETLPLLPPDET